MVRVWDANTGLPLAVLQGHTNYVTSVNWSPDGTKLASGSWDKTVRVWNDVTNTGSQLAVLEGHTSDVTSVN